MKKLFVLFICVVFLFSCAGMSELNPVNIKGNHARGNWVNRTFLAAWVDYQFYAGKPNLTEAAKELLKTKRIILKNFIDPVYGPINIFNSAINEGVVVTDQMWTAMLDKLLELESGWYTTGEMYTGEVNPIAYSLDPKRVLEKAPEDQRTDENLNKILKSESINASVIKDGMTVTGAKEQIATGIIIELLRTGIHCLRVLLQQRGKTEEELTVLYRESWERIQQLDANTLVEIK